MCHQPLMGTEPHQESQSRAPPAVTQDELAELQRIRDLRDREIDALAAAALERIVERQPESIKWPTLRRLDEIAGELRVLGDLGDDMTRSLRVRIDLLAMNSR